MNFLDASTTPANLLATVTAGVQSTGSQIWPFIVLAGIPIAFAIGGFVVTFVKSSVGGVKMSTGPLGYYKGQPGGGEAIWDADQKGGKEKYDIQHKGFTEF